jgi:hypothetical protein
MGFSARTVIGDARLRHALFDDKVLPTPVAVGLLDGVVRRLRAQVVERMPHILASQQQLPLPFDNFETGAVMPPYLMVLDVMAFVTSAGVERGEPVAIIPFQQRFESGPWPACFLVRDGLYLKGDGSEWSGYRQLLVTYVPSDTRLESLDTEIDLPDVCLPACVEGLAALFATRLSDRLAPTVVATMVEMAALSQDSALNNITTQRRTERWVTSEY